MKQNNKIIKLKNKYTGEMILTRNINDVTISDGIKLIRAFFEFNPQRTFLVNVDAYTIVK